MVKKYKSKTGNHKKAKKPSIKKWQVFMVVAIIAVIGILVVYQGFASTDYVYKKSYSNTDTTILQTSEALKSTSSGAFKKLPVVELSTSNDKNASSKNSAVSYKFTLPVGEYRLCQEGQVLSEEAILDIGLIANGADATAGTYSQTVKKNPNISELVCAQFSIPLDLPRNAGEVEYIVKVSQNPANGLKTAQVNLSTIKIYVQNDINVGTSTRNNELHKGDTCKGSRTVGGEITDEVGGSVPAQLGIDFHYPDGYKGNIENDTGTGYERLVYLNITDPQEKNKRWCADIPPGVDRVSIEAYSRTVYDHSGKLVNNALMFGNAQYHNVDMAGKNNVTKNLLLPNVCGSPGIPPALADTGKITMESVRINGELLDITPNPSDPGKNAVWRSIAWSRNLDPGQVIAGYGALSVKQPHTPSANVIDRLASKQKYLTKYFVARGNHQYKFEIPGVYVSGCGDTRLRVAITDSQFGVYGSTVSGFARVFVPGRPEEQINFSSIVEEPNGKLVIGATQ